MDTQSSREDGEMGTKGGYRGWAQRALSLGILRPDLYLDMTPLTSILMVSRVTGRGGWEVMMTWIGSEGGKTEFTDRLKGRAEILLMPKNQCIHLVYSRLDSCLVVWPVI